MEILLESRVFYPSVGGMETVARQLAEAWTRKGHTVQVVTQTPLGEAQPLTDLPVHRQPSLREWLQLLSEADLFVQSGISLKSLPLGLVAGVPIVFVHHTFQKIGFDSIGIRSGIKRVAALAGENIAVSKAVAATLSPAQADVIPNPVEIDTQSTEKSREGLLFVGRLFTEKGTDTAIRALKALQSVREPMSLTICGDGPERASLEQLVSSLDLGKWVTFKGWVLPEEVRSEMSRAVVQVVPSRSETFGVVVLEALAAGCAIVAAETGGLPEAVGPCGVLVPPDDPEALAHGIREATARRKELLAHREVHLAQFQIDTIADQYLEVFEQVVEGAL